MLTSPKLANNVYYWIITDEINRKEEQASKFHYAYTGKKHVFLLILRTTKAI